MLGFVGFNYLLSTTLYKGGSRGGLWGDHNPELDFGGTNLCFQTKSFSNHCFLLETLPSVRYQAPRVSAPDCMLPTVSKLLLRK